MGVPGVGPSDGTLATVGHPYHGHAAGAGQARCVTPVFVWSGTVAGDNDRGSGPRGSVRSRIQAVRDVSITKQKKSI